MIKTAYVEKWDTYEDKKFTRCLTLLIAPVLPVPPKCLIHSLTQ